ncbi:aspartic peptidase domain-containing protein [Cercophora newfieldiana]|uniref:Aspartic peptidase domain-containing protein n=1 Tax=Cercophora newfieldiana TaxID=92897 RepID=A0AA40CU50_9PEZI|nr:aspartic peptidase domain-containing protein [Cercophora newfieldiana]
MDADFQFFSSLRYDPSLRDVPNSSFTHAGWNHINTSPLYMLDYHRDRMLRAATYWGWSEAIATLSGDAGLKQLETFILRNIGDESQQTPLRVKVTVSKDGNMSVITGPVPQTTLSNLYPQRFPAPGHPFDDTAAESHLPSKTPEYEVVIADLRTRPSEYTHFKTTKREMYDTARERAHINLLDKKEVLIINEEDGSIMEGSTTTPYLWRDGKWVTPIVSRDYRPKSDSGGQDGTSRRWALERIKHSNMYVPWREPKPTPVSSIFQVQAALRQEFGLTKVKAIRNKNYTPHGTKSYVRLLNRFGFQPTKPGPYFHKCTIDKNTAPRLIGLPRSHNALVRKTPVPPAVDASQPDVPGEVTAEDQQNDSMYLCEVSIGTPAQKLMLDFDTGSSDLWLPGWLSGLGSGPNNFDPSKSSTFKPDGDKAWMITYGDGSSASGNVGTDVVTIGGLVIKDQAVELATQMSAQFSQGAGDGLLGLAFPMLNTITTNGQHDPQPTPIVNMINQSDIPKEAELFTSCFYSSRDKEQDSFYTFGWIDDELVKASGEDITWADIDNSEGFWMFPSESFTVNGQKIAASGNKAIADTGTTLALVSDSVCDALYKQIKGSFYSEEYQGYLIPNTITADDLPDFSVAVGSKEFVIQKEGLLFAPADSKNWYGGVQSRGQNPFDILGDTFLKSIYAIWDQGNNRFGAVPKIEQIQNITPPAEGSGAETKCGSAQKKCEKAESKCEKKAESKCEKKADNQCETTQKKCETTEAKCETTPKKCEKKESECGDKESGSCQTAC